ncbi:MAG: polysaccharide deacetylase family protein [Planctomycetota bacterium]|nr:polysaccharide deacetylase family protein [Planctomycetota bacterium]
MAGLGKRELLARFLDRSGCNRILQTAGTWHGLLTLNYHRIGNATDSLFDRPLWSASEAEFAEQVRYLSRNFDVIGLDDLEDVFSRRKGRHVLITFDDGYRDNHELAFPILQAAHVPAAFFIATGFIDNPRVPWWDEIAWMARTSPRAGLPRNVWTIVPVEFDEPARSVAIRQLLKTFKQLEGHETERFLNFLGEELQSGRCPRRLAADQWMTWDMIREMRAGGMSFGAHTENHPLLARLQPEEQDREIRRSRFRLEIQLGESIDAFSYPIGKPGAFDEVTRACLQEHGYRWAFSYYGGYADFRHVDRYDLPRVAVEADTSASIFRSMTSLPRVFAR